MLDHYRIPYGFTMGIQIKSFPYKKSVGKSEQY
jgi:hypothetical protein